MRDNGHSSVPASQSPFSAAIGWRPQQDSNLRTRLRRVYRFNSLAITDTPDLEILERRGSVDLSWRRLAAGTTAAPCYLNLAGEGTAWSSAVGADPHRYVGRFQSLVHDPDQVIPDRLQVNGVF